MIRPSVLGYARMGLAITLSWFVFSCTSIGQTGNAPVAYDANTRVFRMDAAGVTYVLGVNEHEQVQTLYWGKRLSPGDAFPAARSPRGYSAFDLPITLTQHEFVGWGGGIFLEPDLKITFPDGNRDLALKYVSSSIKENKLNIVMKDISREVYVTLHYAMDAETGIVRRSAEIENRSDAAFTIEQAAAGTYNLPRGTDYHLHFLTGRWAAEWSVQDEAIRGGKIVLESRRGTTGSQNIPFFVIDRDISKDQEQGDAYFGALAWSGSWQISIEQDALQQVHITGGLNAFDFGYRLKKGEKIETPEFFAGFSSQGIGGASRLMHRLEIDSIVPNAPNPRLRPVIYNSWEATTFHLDEAGQVALAEKAASIGVERFVMDDGWFGQRMNDRAGLGDWYVNKEKFPHGLKPLIDKVHSLGMEFGLWVEPEMVNADSDLYRNHPDWILNFPGRPHTEGRNQMVLNLARPDVRAYVMSFLNKLLAENEIDFLKWDYNRNWSEPGWSDVPLEDQKDVYYDFTKNFYSILEELRSKHPKLEIESCSGGGSRVDLGVMRYTDQDWPSDNTNPVDRLVIQNGFTYPYSPGLMVAWVTDSSNLPNRSALPLEFRFLSSMQGALGVGANLNKYTPEDFAVAKRLIAQYKTLRETIQRGLLYRLIPPEDGSDRSATEYVSRNGKQVVVFAFLHSSIERYPYPTLKLRGLDEDAVYKLEAFEGRATNGAPSTASGSYWMNRGLDVNMNGDFQAAGFTLTKVAALK
ncbi:MAG TPA: alpha-galactosidase [Terracidiphilus sp.]|nr:alpha-galactosidase [Terracidiphilus sp.]